MEPQQKSSKKSVLIRSGLHVARQPGRAVARRIKTRLEKHGWKHRIFDVLALVVFCGVIAGGAYVLFFRNDPGKHVELSAVVAPRDVISGGASTLSLSYTNNSKTLLTNTSLTLEYPPYFVLQGVEEASFEPQTNTVAIGDLPPGAHGLLKIRGVMFGDVLGTQTFSSTLSYAWDDDKTGVQKKSYTFSPSASALVIESALPDQLVAGQSLEGTVTLKNSGPVTFPEASVHALFPQGFRLRSTSLKQREDTTWIVPSLVPNETLVIQYEGSLAAGENTSSTFRFEPSFVFGDERFTQDAFEETVTTLANPFAIDLTILEGVESNRIPARVHWTTQNDTAIENVSVEVDGASNTPQWRLDTPVQTGQKDVVLIPANDRAVNRVSTLVPKTTFTLTDSNDAVTVQGEPKEVRLETALDVNAFVLYFTDSGDQLGRGPLPPRVGQETTYWIVWNIEGTQNTLVDLSMSATLPPNVAWINKQSVTFGGSLSYSENTRTVTWNIPALDPTVIANKTVAASFAVTLIPSASDIGTRPALVRDVHFRATDTWVEKTLTRSLGHVTTRVRRDAGTGVVRD
ncbi:hypothetical protein HYV72_02020 [Candidatus Uhrbacteria bacterium]|nr:hypothetical protein [Candidatus Uhrbacteria bacterium]